MAMIRIRRIPGAYQFNTQDGTTMVSAVDLVQIACSESDEDRDRLRKLEEIVGRLMERLPASEWLDIVQSYALEEVK